MRPQAWTQDSIWHEIRAEAEQAAACEPILLPRLKAMVLDRPTLAASIAAVVARRLATEDLPESALRELFDGVMRAAPGIAQQAAADLAAVKDRDPACPNLLHVVLNLKGFQSLQSYRIAHALWREGRQELAFALSNQASVALGVDIHPAARIGSGVMFDHATGIVIGETSVVEDHVSILQNVTLGGTGKEHGDRHPKIRSGVMIGAGAKILGNIEVGTMSKVAAGSVVLRAVPPHCTVAGVPARIVRHHRADSCPSDEMDQSI
ncbi:serine acetyltransferase [Noviherbaspirillum denitrificans]|uniref:Serine acetyltransferase n=2 Tax=Noviherbaspirillum denitrificans TaxID=1968433 RepID=A0A254TJZ1_9BURK|nr:serine acetyltransferase [Noviherbaspirillum denitrificans]